MNLQLQWQAQLEPRSTALDLQQLTPYIKPGAHWFSHLDLDGVQDFGVVDQQVFSTLNGALLDDTAGTGGSGTSITLASTTTGLSKHTGTIKVGAEFISYTGISSNDLTGITRAAAGTRSAHSSGAGVEVFTGWGIESLSQTLTIRSSIMVIR